MYASQAQEAFLEGHVTAFEVTGGVPWRHIRYDNLSPAVSKVMTGRSRKETARWLSFRSWYGFEAFYCIPGVEGAHEKGGVEGEIGRFRRGFLVPVPRVRSLARAERAAGRGRCWLMTGVISGTGRRAWQPISPLSSGSCRRCRATGSIPARCCGRGRTSSRGSRVGKCRYSVPARLIGQRVRIQLTANELAVYDGSRKAAVHPRLAASGAEHLDLDHYLEILLRKPGALPGSVPLAQARKAGAFTPAHEALWSAARTRLGDGPGTRALIEVLLLHRRLPAASVIAGITAALGAGTCSPDVVAVEARKHADAAGRAGRRRRRPAPAGAMPAGAAVITLPRRRGPLPADGRPCPVGGRL